MRCFEIRGSKPTKRIMDYLLPDSASSEATSRQKSCNACVRSKRKCDKLAPVCSRCAERDEPCVYKRRRLAPAHQKIQAVHPLPEDGRHLLSLGASGLDSDKHVGLQTSTPNANAPGPIYHDNSAAILRPTSFPLPALSPFHFDFMDLNETHPTDSNPPSQTTATVIANTHIRNDDEFVGHNSEDPFLNFTIDPSLDSSMWLAPSQQGFDVERAGTPVNDEISATYEKMGDLCTPFEPWILYDPTSRSSYLHNRVKAFPSDFATRNATPFLHRHLYKDRFMPPCILACFSTSVMYTNQTDANKGMVLRALQQEVDKLVGGEASVAVTPLDKLARVHALFLYQVIRLFDGDVALRAGAERDLPVLEAWVSELCRVRDNLGGGGKDQYEDFEGILEQDMVIDDVEDAGNSVRKMGCLRDLPVPDSWERWIFAESVRRTILMVYSVIGMYQLMKRSPVSSGAPDDLGPWKYIYRWTLSRPLWEAESFFDFYRAWEEKKPHFVIDNYALGEFLEHGRPELVDEFGKIMLTAYVGQDATKEFLASKPVSNTTVPS